VTEYSTWWGLAEARQKGEETGTEDEVIIESHVY
jgi:hypothetical protein